MPRGPLTEEERQRLIEAGARGRAARDANAKARREAQQAVQEGDEDALWMADAEKSLSREDKLQHVVNVKDALAEPRPLRFADPPPPAGFTETPEFREAVEAAVLRALADKTEEIAERLASQRNVLGESPHRDESGFARVLAGQLAELIDQDRARLGKAARLPAEEIETRRQSHERMEALLIEAYAGQTDPQYNVMKPCYFDEQLIDATWQNSATKILMRRQIVWYGVPNEHLVPCNSAAEAIHAAFLRSIGGHTPAINRPDLGRPKLKVVGSSDVETAPTALGQPKQIGMLKLIGDTVQGQIQETRVLGTVAAPARQLA